MSIPAAVARFQALEQVPGFVVDVEPSPHGPVRVSVSFGGSLVGRWGISQFGVMQAETAAWIPRDAQKVVEKAVRAAKKEFDRKANPLDVGAALVEGLTAGVGFGVASIAMDRAAGVRRSNPRITRREVEMLAGRYFRLSQERGEHDYSTQRAFVEWKEAEALLPSKAPRRARAPRPKKAPAPSLIGHTVSLYTSKRGDGRPRTGVVTEIRGGYVKIVYPGGFMELPESSLSEPWMNFTVHPEKANPCPLRRRNSDEERRRAERAAALGGPREQARHAAHERRHADVAALLAAARTASRLSEEQHDRRMMAHGRGEVIHEAPIDLEPIRRIAMEAIRLQDKKLFEEAFSLAAGSDRFDRKGHDLVMDLMKLYDPENNEWQSERRFNPRRRNSDEEIRRLERAASQGDPVARRELVSARRRAGLSRPPVEISLEDVTKASKMLGGKRWLVRAGNRYVGMLEKLNASRSTKHPWKAFVGSASAPFNGWEKQPAFVGAYYEDRDVFAPGSQSGGGKDAALEAIVQLAQFGGLFPRSNPGPAALAPLIMVGNGNDRPPHPRRKRNFLDKATGKPFELRLPADRVKGTLTLEEAMKEWPKEGRFAQAAFKDFHGGAELSDQVVILDNGSDEVTHVWTAGRSPEVTYGGDPDHVPDGSVKSDALYVHKTDEKKRNRPTYLVGVVPKKQAELRAQKPVTRDFMLIGSMVAKNGWLRD